MESGGRLVLKGGVRFKDNRLVPGKAGGEGAGDGSAYGIDLFLMPGAKLEGGRPEEADIYVFEEEMPGVEEVSADSG